MNLKKILCLFGWHDMPSMVSEGRCQPYRTCRREGCDYTERGFHDLSIRDWKDLDYCERWLYCRRKGCYYYEKHVVHVFPHWPKEERWEHAPTGDKPCNGILSCQCGKVQYEEERHDWPKFNPRELAHNITCRHPGCKAVRRVGWESTDSPYNMNWTHCNGVKPPLELVYQQEMNYSEAPSDSIENNLP